MFSALSNNLRRVLPLTLLAIGAGGLLLLTGSRGLQAALGTAAPAAVGLEQGPTDGLGRRVEFGLGSLSVHREGVDQFGVKPGGLRVLSADLVRGSYELSVDEPGDRDAGYLSLELAFSPAQSPDTGNVPLSPGSVQTRLGVVNVIVLDALDRRLETRLAPSGDGLRIDVQDSGDVAYPLSVSVSRVASAPKNSVHSLGQRLIGAPGESGDTEAPPFEPTPVVSDLNACSYLDVSAGTNFTLALGQDHLVYAWGRGRVGQLGDATVEQRASAAPVPLLSSINAIAAGGAHGVALDANGVVWCWGENSDGQLGRGTILSSAVPTPVLGLPPIVAIAAGDRHTLAVGGDGSVWSWGEGGFGQLGTGSNGQQTSPVQILPPSAGATAVAAGFEHSLVLLGDTTLAAFGRNDAGQLGDGIPSPFSLVPVPVAGGGGYLGIAAGWKHSLAWKIGGSAWSWGDNALGQLGDGTVVPRNIPGPVALPLPVVHMDAGSNHSLSAAINGLVHAWGSNFLGQTGNGTLVSPVLVPSPAAGVTGATRVAGGWEHSLALTGAGRVYSWARNIEGELGLGIATVNTFPVHVLDFDLDGFLATVTQVSAGLNHSLAVKADGSVWAWGENVDGQIGDGTTITRHVPVQVMPAGSGAIAVAAGYNHSLALLASGQVRAWGSDATGQLGNGSLGTGGRTDQLVPGVVFASGNPPGGAPLMGIAQIAAGAGFSLARNSPAGNVLAWGANDTGQCADGLVTNPRQNPVNIKDLASNALVSIVDIDAGEKHGLAVKSDGTVYGWGNNQEAQLGSGGFGSPFRRAAIVSGLGIGSGAIGVAAGDFHSLAYFVGGTAQAWGSNLFGQLGDGTIVQRTTPVPVLGIAGIAEIDAGSRFTVARVSGLPPGTPNLRAWGFNSVGQLADGSFSQREFPAVVRELAGATQISAGGSHALALRSDATVAGWGQATLGALGVDYKDAVPNATRVEFGANCSNQAPSCNAGVDIVAACDGPTLNGSVNDLDGDTVTVEWTTACVGVTFSPSANVLDPQVFFSADCGVNCDLTLTVSDSNGGLCSDTVNVIVDDATAPAGTMGSIAPCYATQGDAELAAGLATNWSDNCGVASEFSAASGTSCDVTISVIAQDYCGNMSTAIVYPTRIDATPPVVLAPAPLVIECTSPGGVASSDPRVVAWLASATVTDGCGGATAPTNDIPPFLPSGCAPGAPTMVTFTSQDPCGNVGTAMSTIRVVDSTPPSVTAGSIASCYPTVAAAEAAAIAATTAFDNCSTTVTKTAATVGTCTATITVTGQDDCLNAMSVSYTTRIDDTPPVVVAPAPLVIECTSPGGVPSTDPRVVAWLASATATDNCGGATAPTNDIPPFLAAGCAPGATTLVTFTSQDPCGNTSSESQLITVVDATAPVLSGVPANTDASCGSVPPPATPTATDNCDSLPTITYGEVRTDGACSDTFTLTRTWTATDDCGNTTIGSQIISVADTTPPTISAVPGNVTVQCDSVPSPANPTASDNCDPSPALVFNETRADGPCPSSYTLTRTWTATDRCANVATRQQIVTVIDTTSPVVTPRTDDLYCLWPANHQYRLFTRSQFSPTIADNCTVNPDWKFVGCQSNQPDDAAGGNDGNTSNDCVVDPLGQWFKVRAERDSKKAGGRRYMVTITATDDCGNNSTVTPIGGIFVPLKNPGETCLVPDAGM